MFFEMFLSLSSRILQHISLCIDQSLSLKLFSKECMFFLNSINPNLTILIKNKFLERVKSSDC